MRERRHKYALLYLNPGCFAHLFHISSTENYLSIPSTTIVHCCVVSACFMKTMTTVELQRLSQQLSDSCDHFLSNLANQFHSLQQHIDLIPTNLNIPVLLQQQSTVFALTPVYFRSPARHDCVHKSIALSFAPYIPVVQIDLAQACNMLRRFLVGISIFCGRFGSCFQVSANSLRCAGKA